MGIYGNRTETNHNHSNGEHQLIIKQVKMTDRFVTSMTPTNIGDYKTESRANLTVHPVEQPPKIRNILSVKR